MVTTRSKAVKNTVKKGYKKPKKTSKTIHKIKNIEVIDIHQAIRNNNMYAIKKAIKNNQNLEEPEDISRFRPKDDSDENGWKEYQTYAYSDPTKLKAYKPLTLAIMHYRSGIALQLIRAGVELDHKPNDTEQYSPDCLTALAACVIKRDFRVMKALLAAGAKVDKTSWCYGKTFDYDNHIKYTPLMIAIERQNKKMIKILLEAGADTQWSWNGDYCVRDIAIYPRHFDKHTFTKILGFS
jgi:ankyrin repeat protein